MGITLKGHTRSSPASVLVPAARVPAQYNGISNYESASILLHKPMSHGLGVEAAYTWSGTLKDDMDDSGWGEQFGDAFYQDAYNPRANYAKSNLDRNNVLKGTVLYNIPLGKGHQFLNSAARAMRCWAVGRHPVMT